MAPKKKHKMSRGNMIGLVLTGTLATFGLVYSIFARSPERDATGCIVGAPLAHAILMMVDATDPLTPIHRARVSRAVDDTLREAPIGAKLIVLAIQPEEAPQEAFARCNPGATGSELTENVARLRATYETTFATPLRDAVNGLAGASGSSRSPIIEAFATVTTRADFDRRVPQRTLLIASDMLQNSAALTHYRGDFAQAFRRSALATGDQPDFAGVDVVIDYFARPEQRARQGARHREWWATWFKERGAKSVRFLGVAAPSGRTS